jgi:TolB-like protein/Flp pilus assembly protein TadD
MIGVEMFNRPVDYDTANDSVVRVKATEVRKKLGLAYIELGPGTDVVIQLPPGSYIPQFHFRQEPPEIEPNPGSPAETGRESPMEERERAKLPSAVPPLLNGERKTYRLRVVVAITCLFACLGLGWLIMKRLSEAGSVAERHPSILVLPFESLTGDSSQSYIADGITEQLIDELGRLPEVRVISRTSAMGLKNSRVPLPELAKEFSVDLAVEGSVMPSADGAKISVRLIDAKTDRRIWGNEFSGKLNELLGSDRGLSQSIANQLTTTTGRSKSRPSPSVSVSSRAEDLYLQGLLTMHSGDRSKALEILDQAIKLDKNFASAYATEAACYDLMSMSGQMPYADAIPLQKANALRAIEIEPDLSEGHAELANALIVGSWDWGQGRTELEKAVALNPSSADVHRDYGNFLLLSGDQREALKEERYAVALDPLSSRAQSDLAFTEYFSRHYREALVILDKAVAAGINIDRFAYGDTYAELGDFPKATSVFASQGDNPHALGHLGNLYARTGETSQAQGIIRVLEQRFRKDSVGAYEIALVYAGLGDNDEAFKWLNEAFVHRDRGLIYLRVDPPLDPLRSDARFLEVQRKVGLQ